MLAGARDVYLTLFQPMSRGSLAHAGGRAVWRACHAVPGARALAFAGPSGLVVVIGVWAAAIGLGWALMLWTALPEEALLAQGLERSEQHSLADAVYWSFTVLTTLGFGDITPLDDGLRLAVVMEALMGFALLSAAISWIAATTRAVGDARRLAAFGHTLDASGASGSDSDAVTVADAMARQIRGFRIALRLHPQVFFFRGPDPTDAVPNALSWARRLSREGSGPAFDRLGLEVAEIERLLADRRFVGATGAGVDVLERYRRLQRWDRWRS